MFKIIHQLKGHSNFRLLFIILNDLIIINLCLYLSYIIRLDYLIHIKNIYEVFIYSSFFYILIFLVFKIYNNYFRFFNIVSVKIYYKYLLTFSLIFFIFTIVCKEYFFIPRSLIVIYPSLLFLFFISNRYLISVIFKGISESEENSTVVIGFDDNINQSLFNQFNIKYYADILPKNINRNINGVKIIDINFLIKNIKKIKFKKLLIFDQTLFEKFKFELRDKLINEKILVQRISFENNNYKFENYFDFNYIFNRKSKITKIDNLYTNKTILITGAGGSIGAGILSQLIEVDFEKLVIIEKSEFNLFKLKSDLRIDENDKVHTYLMNFEDFDQLNLIFSRYKIDIIFHAAAYKHVPLLEFNPFAAVKNNFINTFNFIKFSQKFNVSYFCLISSDKAVRPTNIMGASKRLAELAALYLSNYTKYNMIINCVRFGNVINSSGSVLPLFMKQITNNQPITITDKRMIRYFMTTEEAANLVLSVHKISKGGEIFLLDMGSPVNLLDLVKLVGQFAGRKVGYGGKNDLEIKYIGLRKGEKLFEELLIDNQSKQTNNKNIYQSLEKPIPSEEFEKILKKIQESTKNNDRDQLKSILKNKFIGYKDEFK